MLKYSDADLVLNNDGSVYHLNLKPHNVSENIIVVGDPGRVYRISRHFDQIEFEMNKREFITHTGMYKGKLITVMSTGMGVDNIEIAMIELDALFNIDLKKRVPKEEKKSFNVIRIGTSGAIQEDIKVGSEIISDYGIGLDNLMLYYHFEQTADELAIVQKLQRELDMPFTPYIAKGSDLLKAKIGEGFTPGNTLTSPGFYAPQGREVRIPVRNPKLLDQIIRFNHEGFWLTNFEMETSLLYAFASMLGHEAISVNAVLGNRARGTFIKDPNKIIDSIILKVLDRI
ncbi:MAG: nucleoside phosphorylase [Cyclobacteriaceae bacterium]|nr:nucleoside phosphorylase [Cyclobacteriaceae bacterium]